MISLSDINNAFKNSTPEEREEFNDLFSQDYVTIEEYNDLKASHLDTLELLASAMKRISQIEGSLFLQDSEGEIIRNDEDEPIISPKLELEVIEDAKNPFMHPTERQKREPLNWLNLQQV